MKYRISTLQEYDEVTKEICCNNNELWFRGHASAAFRLEPSLHRWKKQIRPLTEKMRDFKLTKGDVMLPNEWAQKDKFRKVYQEFHPKKKLKDIECLYLMQHYGIHTRLLDFSTDPRIALYFALAERPIRKIPAIGPDKMPLMDYDLEQYDAAVYCINPLVVNQGRYGINRIVEVTPKQREFLNRLYAPLAIRTKFRDKRISAQKGVFLLFGSLIQDLEYNYWKESHIYKIIIPNQFIENIYQELRASGLTHFSIYPDITGKVMDLNEEMIDKMDASYAKLSYGANEDL